jgi:hypothetical protein
LVLLFSHIFGLSFAAKEIHQCRVRQKKKAEENATFYLIKDGTFFPSFVFNEPGTAAPNIYSDYSIIGTLVTMLISP